MFPLLMVNLLMIDEVMERSTWLMFTKHENLVEFRPGCTYSSSSSLNSKSS